MAIKEIFASIEIADHEVRLIVGEFYESRFNILRVEKASINGIDNKRIVNEQNIANGIIKVLKQAEDNLGYHIESVLLVVPSVNVKRVSTSVKIVPETVSRRIRLSDIQRGRNEAIKHHESDDLVLVNIGCSKYTTNGISSRKMPINELCEELTMEVDLLFADKEVVYSYASCVEKAGLKILDICLDSYAIAQEAAIFEQTLDKYIVLIDVEQDTMTLSLFAHGRLISSRLEAKGYNEWFKELKEKCNFSTNIAYRLAQNTCRLETQSARDTTIYVYSQAKEQHQLSEKEVASMLENPIANWIDDVNELCSDIINSGEAKYILTGAGMEILAIPQLLDKLNAPNMVYVPQTIGARDSSYCACLGCFYAWKEQQEIKHDTRTSCPQQEVERVMEAVKNKANENDEGSFTKKLKKILTN